jgi:hypothetical protein
MLRSLSALVLGCASQRADLCVTSARLAGRGELVTIAAGERIHSIGAAAISQAERAASRRRAKSGGPALPDRDPMTCARNIDAGGAYVLPGFHDAHIHMMSGGAALGSANLEGAKTIEEIVARVKAHAASHPDSPWVVGRGFSYDVVPAGSFPHRSLIDGIDPRPIVLESYDGHALWVSTAALGAAGVTDATPDPADGTIVRDASGPTGMLLEGATALIDDRAPEPSRAEQLAQLSRAIDHVLALGVTSINDFAPGPDTFELYEALARADRLPIRVTVSLPLEGDLDRYAALRARGTEDLRLGYLKAFADGVVESKTAFVLEPYAGSAERGRPLIAPDDLLALVRRANDRGFDVALHAIGDAAVRLALDTFAQAAHPGNRIEHIEVADPADLARFRAHGVIASMQPFHANPFGPEPEKGAWSENLGPTRWPHTFPWRALLDARASLVFGSDWPVMTADPLEGLAVAVTRRDRNGHPERGWTEHQKVTLEEALSAYARPIVSGAPADLVILEKDVDLEDPRTLWGPRDRVRAVVVAGRVRMER